DYFVASENPAVATCGISERLRILSYFEDPPVPTSSQTTPEFCASWEPTLEELIAEVPSGFEVEWYDSASGGNILSLDTPLVDGESYFAAGATANQCYNSTRLEFVPTIHEVEDVSLQGTTLNLCTIDEPTVESLMDLEMEGSASILWYEVPEGGTPLSSDHPLEEKTYYAESYDTQTDCANVLRVPVIVRLGNCPPEQYDFFIPNAFTPNGDGRNDEFYVPNIEYIFPDFTLEILNRYGNTLFKGNRSNPRWDGSNNGNGIAPNGVYFFILDYHNNQHEPVQGTIYLNR
ncbi:MAG: gliding motility-associated C-terminal domain-containing protein, partial [Flavobacteriaceae bacterium]